MSNTLFLIAMAVIPMIIYPLFIYWMDRYEKEPKSLLIGTFLWGFIPAAILSLIFQLILNAPFLLVDETGTTAELMGAIVLAPITEEIFKGLAVLLIFVLWQKEFDGLFDGIIYGALVGFGFAAVENILYFIEYAPDDNSIILLRSFIFGLNHAFFTSLTGIGFGVARHTKQPLFRFLAPLGGLLLAIFLHFVHNISVSMADEIPGLVCIPFLSNYTGIVIVFLIMILAIRRERQWVIDQLPDEITVVLSQDTYDTISSPFERWAAMLTALTSKGFNHWRYVRRYFNALTELAYKKHAYSRRGEKGARLALIEELRQVAIAFRKNAEL